MNFSVYLLFSLLGLLAASSKMVTSRNKYGIRARLIEKCEKSLVIMEKCLERPALTCDRFVAAYSRFERNYKELLKIYELDDREVRYHFHRFVGLHGRATIISQEFVNGFEDFLDAALSRMRRTAGKADEFIYNLQNLFRVSGQSDETKMALDMTARLYRSFCNRQLDLNERVYKRLHGKTNNLANIFDQDSSDVKEMLMLGLRVDGAAVRHRLKIRSLDRVLAVLGYK